MPRDTELWVEELLKLNDEEEKMTDKQIKILRSAVEIFAEKGYSATSTSEIAQKAGVAEGTIFRHYKTKKDLLLSIVAPMMAKLIAPFVLKNFTKVLDMPYERYEDFLRAVIRNRLEFARKNWPILKIMLQEIPFQPELREPFKEHVGAKVLARLLAAVEHFQQKGEIIDADPLSLVRLNASVIIGFLFTRFFIAPEHDWDEEREIELCIEFIMHGISTAAGDQPTQ